MEKDSYLVELSHALKKFSEKGPQPDINLQIEKKKTKIKTKQKNTIEKCNHKAIKVSLYERIFFGVTTWYITS